MPIVYTYPVISAFTFITRALPQSPSVTAPSSEGAERCFRSPQPTFKFQFVGEFYNKSAGYRKPPSAREGDRVAVEGAYVSYNSDLKLSINLKTLLQRFLLSQLC